MTRSLPRRVLVTGSSRGIGLQIARTLATQGYQLALSARSASVQDRARELDASNPGQVVGITADLARPEDARELPVRAAEALGGLDAMVLNAGQVRLTTLEQTPAEEIHALLDVNVRATLLMVKAALPSLRKSENARVVVVAPPPTQSARWLGNYLPYAVSKLSLSLAVIGLAEELKRYGIAVTAIWPHIVVQTDAIIHAHHIRPENCRKPEIVADAVSALLALPPRIESGRFFLDEEILRQRGVSDFSHYAVDPSKPLASDLFVS
jgi:citronellol/citronellal dehydrogenase